MDEYNILILAAGTRDKVIRAFRKEFAGQGLVIAADASPYAPALYEADKAYIVPRIDAPGYIDFILEICRKEKVRAVLTLIDPELSLLAKNRTRFAENGVTVIVSSYDLCELSLDKYAMYEKLCALGMPTARCWLTKEDFDADRAKGVPGADYPVFVKPRKGSASIEINLVQNEEMLTALLHADSGLMIQELMRGQEYGCDAYLDLISGRCTSLFLKKKLRMRAGETDKSVSVHEPAVMRRIAEFAENMGFRGMIDLDLFHDEEEDLWYLSEVNPRFGGGYPHAYACGVNFPAAILNNLRGQENPAADFAYKDGVYMMKYNDIVIRSQEELIK